MKISCMKCRKDTENIDPKLVRKKKHINYASKMPCLRN